MTNPNFQAFRTMATAEQSAIYLSEALRDRKTTWDDIVPLLAKALSDLTENWTDDEKEDGGLICDHLSDNVSRSDLARIPMSVWEDAWDIVDGSAGPSEWLPPLPVDSKA